MPQQSLNAQTRNQSLDIAKGLGIMLVVLGHNRAVSDGTGELFKVIFSFHMPLFFFLSGIFLRETGSLKYFVLSRVESLLKPYFATLFLVLFYKIALEIYRNKLFPKNTYEKIIGIFYATGGTIDWVPLWFLPHLFLSCCIVFFVLKIIISTESRLALVCISLLFGVFILQADDLPWSIDLLPISFSFILAGFVFSNLTKSMYFKRTPFFLCGVLFFLLHYFYDETINLNFRQYGNFPIATLQAALGIFLCLSISARLAKNEFACKAIGYIGSGSLFILLFHYFFQEKAFNATMRLSESVLLATLCGFTVGLVVPLALWEMTKRNVFLSALFLTSRRAVRFAATRQNASQ